MNIQTKLPGGITVSTIQMVTPDRNGQRYETLVFIGPDAEDIDGDRYTTANDAQAGHGRLVRKHTPTLTDEHITALEQHAKATPATSNLLIWRCQEARAVRELYDRGDQVEAIAYAMDRLAGWKRDDMSEAA